MGGLRFGALRPFQRGGQIAARLGEVGACLRQLLFTAELGFGELALHFGQQAILPGRALQPLGAGRGHAWLHFTASTDGRERQTKFLHEKRTQPGCAGHLAGRRRRGAKITGQGDADTVRIGCVHPGMHGRGAQSVGLVDDAIGLDDKMIGDARLTLLHLRARDQIRRNVARSGGVMNDETLDRIPGAHRITNRGTAQKQGVNVCPGGARDRPGAGAPFVGWIFNRRCTIRVERRGRAVFQRGDTVAERNGALPVVHAQVAEGFPAASMTHLKQTGAQGIGIAAQLIVVPIQRFPVCILGHGIGRVKPADIPAIQNFVHTRQAGLGDDGGMAIVIALADAAHGLAIEQRRAGAAGARQQRGPAILMKAEIAVGFQGAWEPIEVVRRMDVIASAEVERHRLNARGLQARAKRSLETVERLTASLKKLGKLWITIKRSSQLIVLERSRAGECFVGPHPGINEQAAIHPFGGVAKIILQDAVGIGGASAVRVSGIQPAHLFIQRHKEPANDERIG